MIAPGRVASNERTTNDAVVQTNDGPTDPELIRFPREELGGNVSPDETGWEHVGPIWLWRGEGKDGQPSSMSWHFLTIDGEVAEAIRVASSGYSAAWGSVYVEAGIGADVARAGAQDSADASRLVEELSRSSPDFDRLWQDNEVVTHSEGVKQIRHPEAGLVSLEFSSFAVEGRPELAMIVYNPASRAEAEKVRALVYAGRG